MARKCRACGRRPSEVTDADSCWMCGPTVKNLQSRRAARREAELRVTQRWGSQDTKKIARECGIKLSGPVDPRMTEPPKRPKRRRRGRPGPTVVIFTAFESNRGKH